MGQTAIIKTALFTPGLNGRWGLPLLFEAEPGCGKTTVLKNLGVGLPAIVLLGSIRDAADIGGVMTLVGDTAKLALPSWADEARKLGRCVVVLDELTTAAPSTQAAMLRVVNEGVVGDTELPPGVRFLAACNSVEDAAGGFDISAPMANRFGHLPWDAGDAGDWAGWLLGAHTPAPEGDAEALEAWVMSRWDAAWAQARGMVGAFIQRRPALLHKKPNANDPRASKAWSSRRTWELATRALAGSLVHGLDADDTDTLMASFVGSGPIVEFRAWARMADLPNPADVLDGTVSFTHDHRRADRTQALLLGCAALVAPTNAKDRDLRGAQFWRIVEHVIDANAGDLAVPAAGAALQANVARRTALTVLAKIQPLLDAAGIRA